jgi:hypothetical protein
MGDFSQTRKHTRVAGGITVLTIALLGLLSWTSAGTKLHAAEVPSPVNPAITRLYKAALKLQPKLASDTALQLASRLHTYSTAYRTDPYLSLAIGMQESGLQQINRVEKGKITDYGMFQFHYRTAKWMQLDVQRLQTDLDYAVKKHVKLLAQKQKECRNWGPHSWLCYHSATPAHAQKYKKLVDRYYFRINPSPSKKK